ncbi:MAG: hypothetical protein R2761_21835 [Acidimicrobiales bacterium]
MTHPDDEDELLRLVSEAFDDEIGDPPDHLVEAARALMAPQPRPDDAQPRRGPCPPAGPDDELADRRVHRLERRLAAAAATASRHLYGSMTSADGAITTEMTENDEGRLLVTIRSPDPSLLYVAMAWRPVTAGGTGRRHRLVTPLAPDRSGLSVHYDLGPLDGCDAIDLEPAEAVFVAAVGPEDVTLALSLATTGASRRAWARAEEIHRANGDPLADVIVEGTAP